MRCLARQRIDLIERDIHALSNFFQKSAGSCSAFPIHLKAVAPPLGIDVNNLIILSSDIDNRDLVWKVIMRSACMAGNFRPRVLCKSYIVASIAGRQNALEILSIQSTGGQCCIHGLLCTAFETDSRFSNIRSYQAALAIHKCYLGCRRSDIDASEYQVLTHRLVFSASCSMYASILVRACSSE
jgi:hypothetical protein